MKAISPHLVWIIADPLFSERLASLPTHHPVWIVDSVSNTRVAKRLWAERPQKNHLSGITTFQSGDDHDPEKVLLSILGTVDLHHGEHSAEPPWSVIEVIGGTATGAVRGALAELGFAVVSSDPEGFRASRPVL